MREELGVLPRLGNERYKNPALSWAQGPAGGVGGTSCHQSTGQREQEGAAGRRRGRRENATFTARPGKAQSDRLQGVSWVMALHLASHSVPVRTSGNSEPSQRGAGCNEMSVRCSPRSGVLTPQLWQGWGAGHRAASRGLSVTRAAQAGLASPAQARPRRDCFAGRTRDMSQV